MDPTKIISSDNAGEAGIIPDVPPEKLPQRSQPSGPPPAQPNTSLNTTPDTGPDTRMGVDAPESGLAKVVGDAGACDATKMARADGDMSPAPTTTLVALSLSDGAPSSPGAMLMRLLHEDGDAKSHVPPEYAQHLARLCDAGHPLALWAARYMAIKVCGRSPHTVAAKGRDLAAFIRWFVQSRGHGDIVSWIERDTRRFLSHLDAQGRKPATINRHLYTLGHFARWVHGQPGAVFGRFGLPVLEVTPVPMEESDCRKLSQDELEALFAAGRALVARSAGARSNSRLRPQRNLALLAVLYYTGLRVSEVLNLKRRQYDGDKLFRVRCKGRRTRDVHLHPECTRVLDGYIKRERIWDSADALNERDVADIAEAGEGGGDPTSDVLPNAAQPLFLTKGGRALDRREANRILQHLGDVAEEATGTAISVHAHRLRHTFGARYREASGSDTETAAALGHAGLGYVGRYVRSTGSERAATLLRALNVQAAGAKPSE